MYDEANLCLVLSEILASTCCCQLIVNGSRLNQIHQVIFINGDCSLIAVVHEHISAYRNEFPHMP